jgi:hypothetical protein
MDEFTKFLLHVDGSDGDTTFSDSSSQGHVVTTVGSVAVKDLALGGNFDLVANFPGSSNYLKIADSDDWDLDGASAWTIDYRVIHTQLSQTHHKHVCLGRYDKYGVYVGYNYNGYLWLWVGGQQLEGTYFPFTPTTGVEYHIAVVKSAGYIYVYINGVQVGSAQAYTGTINTQSYENRLGAAVHTTTESLIGYLSEVRISKGVARWTSNFDPPTEPYASSSTALELDTIVGDGGAVFSGSSVVSYSDVEDIHFTLIPSGGIVAGGSSLSDSFASLTELSFQPSGGALLGGASTLSYLAGDMRLDAISTGGGIVVGGSADIDYLAVENHLVDFVSSGGVIVGGASAGLSFAGDMVLVSAISKGGAIVGGSAETSFFTALTELSHVTAGGILFGGVSGLASSMLEDSTVTATTGIKTLRLYLSTANGKELYHVADITPGVMSYSIQSGDIDVGNILENHFVSAPPGCRIIAHYKGRVYVADNYGSVYYSNYLSPDQFNLKDNWLQFPDVVDIMIPVDGGIFFAYGNKTEFYAGTPDDGFNIIDKFDYGGIYGTGQNIKNSSNVAWQSQRGMIVGGPDGSAKNIQEQNVATEKAEYGATLIREQNGVKQFIANIKNPTTSQLAATSWIEAEIVRRS